MTHSKSKSRSKIPRFPKIGSLLGKSVATSYIGAKAIKSMRLRLSRLGIKNLQFLASGSNGAIFASLNEDKKVIKVAFLQTVSKTYEWFQEVQMARRCGELNIGPKIYNVAWVDRNPCLGIIVMERMNMDLQEWFLTKNKSDSLPFVNRLSHLFNELSLLKILCIDVKLHNVLVNIQSDGHITKMALIDFGSDWCTEPERNPIVASVIMHILFYINSYHSLERRSRERALDDWLAHVQRIISRLRVAEKEAIMKRLDQADISGVMDHYWDGYIDMGLVVELFF